MGLGTITHIDKPTLDGLYLKKGYYLPNRYMVYTNDSNQIGTYVCTGYFTRTPNTILSGKFSLLEQRIKDLIAMEEI